MNSIRRRLNRTLFPGLLLLTALWGLILHLAFRSVLLGDFDSTQRLLAQTLSIQFERLPDGAIEFDPSPEMSVRFSDQPEAEYFQIRDSSGRTIARSDSLRGADLPARFALGDQSDVWDLTLADGRSGRAVAFEFAPALDTEDGTSPPAAGDDQAPARLLLVYARSREAIDQVLRFSAVSFAALAVLLPLCGALLLGRVVRRGLQPLDRLSEEIRAMEPGDLSRRFPESGLPAELSPIAGRINQLLDRVARAIEREKRFSSDVAHELRTPISELRILAEVALGSEPEAGLNPAVRRSFEDALEIALQMERVVSALFALMRARHEDGKARFGTVDLAALLTAVWNVWRGTADSRGLLCDFRVPDRAPVESDESLLRALLSNILENAVAHAPPGGRIEVRLESEGGGWALTVANTNATLAKADLPKLFDPFWRKDPSRADPRHAGLGLTTAAAFAVLVGARLRSSLPEPGRFEMRIEIPLAPPG